MARLMKSTGIEWIGEIPDNWTISRVKYVSDFEPGCSRDGLNDESVITYTPMDCIKNGWFINNTATLGSVSSSLTSYQNGDVVMAKVTPCFENGNIAIMENLASGYGLGSSELFVFRPINIDTRYFFYWLQNPVFVQLACSTMTGTGGLKRVSPYFVKNCYIHHPSIDEQQRIAAFLDRKCAEIDAVIERTKTTIEEYKKLKQAVITEAVTKGVRGPRPMKDSGIEWIGEIPEGWDSSKLGGVTLSMRNGYVGPTRDLFFETGIRYIQSLHIKDGVIDFDKHPYYVAEEWANEHPKVHTNDILIVQTGDIGQVGIVEPEYDGCNCHALIIATPDCTLLSPRYLMFYLMSTPGKELLLSYKTGALLPHLNAGKIKFTPVLLPALDEQDEIVFYLDEKCAALDTLIAKKTALLTELETYKKSLIYEYVTGKKEIL